MKRGRKPKGEHEDMRAVMTTRITPELRQALDAAAAGNGRSLSQEIETRLRLSFGKEERAEARLGGERSFTLMHLIALGLDRLYHPNNSEAHWLDEPYLFEQATQFITGLLDAIRPRGPRQYVPDPEDADAWAAVADMQGRFALADILHNLKRVDEGALPLDNDRSSRARAVYGWIKARLPEVAGRYEVKHGTAEQLRAIADEMKESDDV